RHPGSRGRSALLGERDLTGRPYVLSAGPGGTSEHTLHRHQQSLVWRRRRSHADLPRHDRGRTISRRSCHRLRILRPQLLSPLQNMVRRVFLSQAPGRAARRRRDLFRLSRRRRLGSPLRFYPLDLRGLPTPVPPIPPPPPAPPPPPPPP